MNNAVKFFIAFACLLLLTSTPVFIYYALDRRWLEGFLSWFLCMAVFCLPVGVFYRNTKIYLYIFIPIIFLSVINLFCVVLYNVPLNYDIFLLAFNTNFNESTELLSKYLPYFFVVLLMFGIAWFFIFKYIPKAISIKQSFGFTAFGLLFIICVPFFKPDGTSYISRIKSNIVDVFPGSVYYSVKMLAQRTGLIHKHEEFVSQFKFNARQAIPLKQRQVYVMIIGESSRYDHWEINGYNKPTSPRLKKETGLISFSNMVTGGYITEFSVPMLITTATAANYDQHYHEKGIVSAFKEVGFNTYWISNQVDFGDILMHSKEADHLLLLSTDYKARKGIHMDMELIGTLKTVMQKDTGNIFVVMHTLGSHYDYDVRYPEEYNFFKPSAWGTYIRPTDSRKKQEIINSYDNSILYTDAVIDSAISLLKGNNSCSWLSYISDHGENLFDDKRNLSQHGYSVPTEYVAHIPWFIWTSANYGQQFPDKVSTLLQNKASQLGSENVFYTLTDIGNLTYPNQSLQKSASSKSFTAQPQLILGGDAKVFNYTTIKAQ